MEQLLSSLNYWIFTLRDAEGYYNWNQAFDTGAIETGYGFTLKGSPNLNIKYVNVFDVSGKQVLSANENSQNSEYQYSTKSLSDAVYIVKIESSKNESFTKKIVVNNKNN
ncbi:MAG: T9SS sorting signal type C domain-containing protein [Tamlana sp.]